MPPTSPPDRLRIVVVSADAAFRRVAGAALSQAGHDVHTAVETPSRLERMVRLRRPQVVVFDVSTGAEPPLAEGLGGGSRAPAVVLVADHPAEDVLAKWGPLDALVSAAETAARARPRLHIV